MAEEKKVPKTLAFADDSLAGSLLNDTTGCSGVAYSGGPVRQWWSDTPVYIDLAGMELAEQIPIMYNHEYEPESRLGEAAVKNDGERLTFVGELDNQQRLASRMIEQGRKWNWQVSIGCSNDKYEYVQEGATATVNGRKVEGPAMLVTRSQLREISLVAIGADKDTHMEIKASLMAPESQAPTAASTTTMEPTPTPKKEDTTMAEDINAKLTAMEDTIAKLQAKLDEQSARPAPEISVKHDDPTRADVLACAVEQAMGIEQKDTRAAEAAQKTYKGHMGLRQLYTEAAQAAGWTGSYINNGNLGEASNAIKAGFSNINLPGILGNAVNKRIKAGYEYAEGAWREIAETVSVSDYKAFTSYSLNAKGDFEEVPNGASIPHGELAESSYSNQLKRYGQMFQIDEMDIINDDLGAINTRAFGFGRKAALKLNKVFWGIYNADSNFYKSANGNVVASAGELNAANLAKLVKAFRQQKDANGDILGYDPAILLVPAALEVEALKLYNDAEIRDNTASKQYLTGNPWRNKFRPVASAYLTSDDDYYLLADPNIAATIQVAFLDGMTAPTIESSAAEFDVFGVRWRAKFSFGVAFADPKAGIKGDKA